MGDSCKACWAEPRFRLFSGAADTVRVASGRTTKGQGMDRETNESRTRCCAEAGSPRTARCTPHGRRGVFLKAGLACIFASSAFAAAFGLIGDPVASAAEFSLADRVSAAAAASEAVRTVGSASATVEVPSLLQNPELPTGCESVALTDVLLFYGFDLEKTDIADWWLPTSSTDFVFSFLGDPRDAASHACLAPCIAQTANSYLSDCGSVLSASDTTGWTFSEVLAKVESGCPVIVWATVDLKDPGDEPYLTQWENGRLYGLYANNHCMVVCGFDTEASTVTVCDPLEGIVDYDMGLLAERFAELGSQAVVIE